jgi:hypothetical protein
LTYSVQTQTGRRGDNKAKAEERTTCSIVMHIALMRLLRSHEVNSKTNVFMMAVLLFINASNVDGISANGLPSL